MLSLSTLEPTWYSVDVSWFKSSGIKEVSNVNTARLHYKQQLYTWWHQLWQWFSTLSTLGSLSQIPSPTEQDWKDRVCVIPTLFGDLPSWEPMSCAIKLSVLVVLSLSSLTWKLKDTAHVLKNGFSLDFVWAGMKEMELQIANNSLNLASSLFIKEITIPHILHKQLKNCRGRYLAQLLETINGARSMEEAVWTLTWEHALCPAPVWVDLLSSRKHECNLYLTLSLGVSV